MRTCVQTIKYFLFEKQTCLLAKQTCLFSLILIIGFLIFSNVEAALIGETRDFNVDPSYDSQKREDLSAVLVVESDKLYIFVDTSLWDSFSDRERNQMIANLITLSNEFENRIYPVLTSNFGSEWIPGIDGDRKITILLHSLRRGAGGYFNEINEYSKFENPNSNEREMVYVNADYLASPLLKDLLAHEFTHLITFNQKERLYKLKEDIWLNEARAEHASTLLGYNDVYQGSYLQRRVNDFVKASDNSLTEWNNSLSDYGILNLFTAYLVDHYGVAILNDSLHSGFIGIESINYALINNGYRVDFADIFTDWAIAVLLNDCRLGSKYCYTNPSLKNLKILPSANYLIASNQSALSVNYTVKTWAGNWHRIVADGEILDIDFNGAPAKDFKISYILCDNEQNCSIVPFDLDENNQGKIVIDNIKKYPYFIIVPLFQSADSLEERVIFFLTIRSEDKNQESEEIRKLLEKISFLKSEINRLKAGLIDLSDGDSSACYAIADNLYFGITNNKQVRCLQEFLKGQGPSVYPEGLVTGNFYFLTQSAVSRFQEKYQEEILDPFGLQKGTGYVGSLTRTKINQLIRLIAG